MNSDTYISVGSIIKPHGIKGELIVRFYNPFTKIIAEKTPLYLCIGGAYSRLNIQNIRSNNKSYIFKIYNTGSDLINMHNTHTSLPVSSSVTSFVSSVVSSIDEAKKYAGFKLFVKKDDIVIKDIKKNEYFVIDLVNLNCYNTKSKNIGIVTEIYSGSGADIMEIKSDNGVYLLPMTEENIIAVDLRTKRVTVKNEELFKV